MILVSFKNSLPTYSPKVLFLFLLKFTSQFGGWRDGSTWSLGSTCSCRGPTSACDCLQFQLPGIWYPLASAATCIHTACVHIKIKLKVCGSFSVKFLCKIRVQGYRLLIPWALFTQVLFMFRIWDASDHLFQWVGQHICVPLVWALCSVSLSWERHSPD